MRIEFAFPLLSLLVSAATAVALLRWRALPMDVPNQRSTHREPVPRGGGLAIWAGWGAALLAAHASGSWVLPAIFLAALSYLDDRLGLSVAVRLPAHFLAAGCFVYLALPHAGPALGIGLALATVWMLNLFNFMDGADGLAGGMALSGFSMLACGALISGDQAFGIQLASLASACLAFLWVNWNPAKVFLGDVGSVPLGFLAAALGTEGWAKGLWPWWYPLLVFLPFIADATFTLIQRAWRRERIWQAHREHAYQKLLQLGWSPKRLASSYLALMLACGLSALAFVVYLPAGGATALFAWTLAHVAAYGAVMRQHSLHKGARHAH